MDYNEVNFDKIKLNSDIYGFYYEHPITGTVIDKRQEWRGNGHPSRTVITIIPNNPIMNESKTREYLILSPDNFHYAEVSP